MGGFFGAASKNPCINDIFYGTDYNSHLGTKRAGIVTFDLQAGFTRSIHNIERNYFRAKFEDELDSFVGNSGVGVISDTDPQPIVVNSHLGRYAVVTVAKINNIREIADELLEKRMHFSERSANTVNPTEVVALLINMGDSFVDGINLVYSKIKGSCSMLILTENGIIAARDYLGRTPIVIGHKEGAYAATSETTAFPNLGYERLRDIGPGEIVEITANGVTQLQKPARREQICSFLWVYYGFPASDYNDINAELVRETAGKTMGEKDDTEADCVCGIPDSGVGFALGYSEGRGIPYHRAVLKYTPTWPRSFMPTIQSKRNLIAKMKLLAVDDLIKDKSLLLIDDSIVRGTQLRETTEFLYQSGAKEVHIRPACPPLLYGCKYLNFSRSSSEMDLITRRVIERLENGNVTDEVLKEYADPESEKYERMVEEIRKELNFTSLRFNRLDDMLDATGLPHEQLCTYCWDGRE